MTSYGIPAQEPLYRRYRRRPDISACPRCASLLRWRSDGVYWYPCDPEPVLCVLEGGTDRVIKRRQLIETAIIWRPGIMYKTAPVLACRPHNYTCGGKI